jgi:hypothetical protein
VTTNFSHIKWREKTSWGKDCKRPEIAFRGA